MSSLHETVTVRRTTLPALGVRPLLFQAGLIAVAVALPAISHRLGLPVLYLLPMHWPVLLAGLAYGWVGGALVGALAPAASFLTSGMPGLAHLPAMTVELAVYGLVAGLLREKARWNPWTALAAALVAGRLAYLAVTLLMGTAVTLPFLQATLLPGLLAAVLQWLLLPFAARWWVKAEENR